MTSSPSLPPQQPLVTEGNGGREMSATPLTPRRRSASASMTDLQRSHSVPPHLVAPSNLRFLPASPTVSETSSSHNSTSSTSASSVGMTDDETDVTASSLSANPLPRLIKSVSTPETLTASNAITRSTSAVVTSSSPSRASPASASASSPAQYTSSSPPITTTASSSASAASLLSSTLASLSSSVTSLFRSSSSSSSTSSSSSSSPPSSSPAARVIPYFTIDTIAQHNTAESFWTIVHGRVYDLTTYLPLHPGGYRLLFKNAGADSTSDFVGLRHSKRAVAVLDAYWIGDVVGTRPMRDIPAGLGSAVKGSREGCVAVSNFAGTGSASGLSAAGRLKKAISSGGGGSGMLGDALRIGDGVEGVRRNHPSGPSNGGRVVPLNTKYQSTPLNHMPPPHPRPTAAASALSNASPAAQSASPPAFTINLITPPEPSSSPSVAAVSSSPSTSLDIVPITFLVSSVKHLAADTVQLVFRLPASSTSSFSMPLSGHVTIEIPTTPTSEPLRRQYTPTASTPSSFTLLVKRYTAQQLGSHYLASLQVGQPVNVHGPYTTLTHSPTEFTDIVMLCMGSGVTPMYQLMQDVHRLSTTSPKSPLPRLHLLYSARTAADVWLRNMIDNTFALHTNASWHHTYLLSRPADATQQQQQQHYSAERVGRLDVDLLYGWLDSCGVVLGAGVLCCVCGSDEYASTVSGWLNDRWRAQQQSQTGSADSGPDIHVF